MVRNCQGFVGAEVGDLIGPHLRGIGACWAENGWIQRTWKGVGTLVVMLVSHLNGQTRER